MKKCFEFLKFDTFNCNYKFHPKLATIITTTIASLKLSDRKITSYAGTSAGPKACGAHWFNQDQLWKHGTLRPCKAFSHARSRDSIDSGVLSHGFYECGNFPSLKRELNSRSMTMILVRQSKIAQFLWISVEFYKSPSQCFPSHFTSRT